MVVKLGLGVRLINMKINVLNILKYFELQWEDIRTEILKMACLLFWEIGK